MCSIKSPKGVAPGVINKSAAAGGVVANVVRAPLAGVAALIGALTSSDWGLAACGGISLGTLCVKILLIAGIPRSKRSAAHSAAASRLALHRP